MFPTASLSITLISVIDEIGRQGVENIYNFYLYTSMKPNILNILQPKQNTKANLTLKLTWGANVLCPFCGGHTVLSCHSWYPFPGHNANFCLWSSPLHAQSWYMCSSGPSFWNGARDKLINSAHSWAHGPAQSIQVTLWTWVSPGFPGWTWGVWPSGHDEQRAGQRMEPTRLGSPGESELVVKLSKYLHTCWQIATGLRPSKLSLYHLSPQPLP